MPPKKGQRYIFKSSNFFPDVISMGIPNNFVYYRSLLRGDDPNFDGNRIIGQQAQAYFNDIKTKHFTLSEDSTTTSSTIQRAIDLLRKAAMAEQKKEKAWLRDVYHATNYDNIESDEGLDYLELIKQINEFRSGIDKARQLISYEAARWRSLDVDKILEQKQKQNSLEAQAKRLEKEGKHEDALERAQEGKSEYWKLKNDLDKQIRLDSKHIKTLQQIIGGLIKNKGKAFIGTGRSLIEHVLEEVMPVILKRLGEKAKNGPLFNTYDLVQISNIACTVAQRIIENMVYAEFQKNDFSGIDFSNYKGFLTDNNFVSTETRKGENGEDMPTTRMAAIQEQLKNNNQELLKIIDDAILTADNYVTILQNNPQLSQKASQIDVSKAQLERVRRRAAEELMKAHDYTEEYNAQLKNKRKKVRTGSKNKDFMQWVVDTKTQSIDVPQVAMLLKQSARMIYTYSEEQSVQDFAGQAIVNFITNNNAKDDAIAGYLAGELFIDETPLQEMNNTLKLMNKRLEQIMPKIEQLITSVYQGTYDKNPTMNIQTGAEVDTFKHNAAVVRQLRKTIENTLQKISEELDEKNKEYDKLQTYYHVSITVKDQSGLLDYYTPNSAEGVGAVGKFYERGIGFSGGAMGKNDSGLSVIDNIVALGKKGRALTDADAEWLKFCVLNSGLGLLGAPLRYTLESYISLFAAYLMFDDAQLAIEDAMLKQADKIEEGGSFQIIHLYNINGVYVPQSYILYELYKRMEYIREANAEIFNKRNLSEGVVRVQIYSYNVGDKYPGNTQQDWENESKLAQDTVKIKMYFLMNMGQLVASLNEKIKTQ